MIAIVNTGGANLNSVRNALERMGKKAELSADPEEIFRADYVLLPGVGAAADSMGRLQKQELVNCLRELKKPTLGICLGMQLLFESSEEGNVDCLGILPGIVSRFPNRSGLPVPHMGWNQVESTRSDNPLFRGVDAMAFFYFVHSFFAPTGDWTSGTCDYGGPFTAAVHSKNYFGVQFHPEKSGPAGAQILRNFLEL